MISMWHSERERERENERKGKIKRSTGILYTVSKINHIINVWKTVKWKCRFVQAIGFFEHTRSYCDDWQDKCGTRNTEMCAYVTSTQLLFVQILTDFYINLYNFNAFYYFTHYFVCTHKPKCHSQRMWYNRSVFVFFDSN